MNKKILGLDLGTTSIGWAYVLEGETPEQSSIEQIGVRVNPLTVDEQTNFEKGKPLSTNADRTLKRGARRNLDRYQLRRKNLMEVLIESNIIRADTPLTEIGKSTTFETWQLRAKAATEKIELEQFARVLFAINKKRGYKSSRKAKNEDEGQAIDGMAIAKKLYEENFTPGQLVFQFLQVNKKAIPDFYRSDLQAEFDKVWSTQKQFYPEIFTDTFYKTLQGKGQRATSTLFWTTYNFNIADIKDIEDSLKNENTIRLNNREKKKLQAYKWRSDAVTKQLSKEEAAFVVTEINNNLNNSSGYLGAISDRSKELFFNKETVGQNQYRQLLKDRHTSLKNQVFYRQDYLDEFETIWTEQAKHYPILTNNLKSEIRNIVIFYQRKLKSQKSLISFCEFESKEIEKNGKKINIGLRVAPRSSPLFQEFKIYQRLNDVEIRSKIDKKDRRYLTQEEKYLLFEELNTKGNLSAAKCLELLIGSSKNHELNFKELDGNRTSQALYEAYIKIIELSGHDVRDYLNVRTNKDEVELHDLTVLASKIKEMVKQIFETIEIDTEILDFNAELDGEAFEQQKSYQLWHLLYSYEGDESVSGNEKLYKLLEKKFSIKREYASPLVNIAFQDDYGSISTKAMRKIYPFIKENNYSTACELAGYRHSKHSLTKEELDSRILKNKLEPLKKNSLRNPVVEKILNQMINVVNELIYKHSKKDENGKITEYFKFDEIRIELARELKKNAAERADMTTNINAAKTAHEKIIKLLQSDFGIKNPTRNDIIRYKLYEELKDNGYKDLYTDTYIPKEILFSKQIDIEHIIPQSRLFDDSFSNKTVVYRRDNLEKGNQTAIDYIESKHSEEKLNAYKSRVEKLFELNKKNKEAGISKAKYKKLLMTGSEIGDGFIERDLRETQYIAKKAMEMLFEISRSVISTSGSITDRLREDWELINVMKEINLPKYRALGLTEMEERKYGQQVEVIKDWTKRNDHRHHAMDALTIAFTRHNHIQYLNYLNARKNEKHKQHGNIIAIEAKETEIRIDDNGDKKRVFKLPIPHFRQLAKEHLESVIVSHKAKNKVVTKNKNKIAGKSKPQEVLTPRGQLHKETVYGKYNYKEIKEEKVSGKFDAKTIEKICNPLHRQLLKQRLEANGNDPKKAFTGKNSLDKNPIFLDNEKTKMLPEKVKVGTWVHDFSIRKDITPDNFKDEKSIEKVLDEGVKTILKKRLADYGNDPKKAFADLSQNPIWLNKEKGICIKRVAISGVSNAVALNHKKDHLGRAILNSQGNPIPIDYVSTGNNHHVAVYKDENGNLQENVVSFFEAVERVNQGLLVIDKTFNQHLGWKFLFTMKQNELFVFPNERTGFNPQEIDLLDPKNKKLISPNLFRVQKFSKVFYENSAVREYVFRHHLETTVNEVKELKEVSYKNIKSLGYFDGIVKVRTNHLGDIVSVGEY